MGRRSKQPGAHRNVTTARHGRTDQPAGRHNLPVGVLGGVVDAIRARLSRERGHQPRHGR